MNGREAAKERLYRAYLDGELSVIEDGPRSPYGPYVPGPLLGHGGAGRVIEAFDPELERKVAIKELAPSWACDPRMTERFLAEARLVARVEHENVCRIHHLGRRNDSGEPFLVLEHVRGESLEALVDREGPLSLSRAVALVRDTAVALRAALEAGVIHRDIKPSNILVTPEGRVKVTDFGLARRVEAHQRPPGENPVMGTPHYLSPEAGRGRPVDHRTDIYSLGATFFHLLTGRTPFDGPTPISILVKHAFEPLPRLAPLRPDLPANTAAVIRRMMAKRPEERYGDYDALIADLEALLVGKGTAAAEVEWLSRCAGGLSWLRRAAACALALFLSLFAAAPCGELGRARGMAQRAETQVLAAAATACAAPRSGKPSGRVEPTARREG